MTKIRTDALEAAKIVCAATPAPRTQAEWRSASTALRTARRLAVARRQGFTATVSCGSSHRYLMADTCGQRAGCYNGGGVMGGLRMIQHHAFLYREGATRSRVADARHFAAISRREGPVALPDLRQSEPLRMAA